MAVFSPYKWCKQPQRFPVIFFVPSASSIYVYCGQTHFHPLAIFSALSLILIVGACYRPSVNTIQGPKYTLLTAHTPVQRTISRREKHFYHIQLNVGQYYRVLIDRWDAELKLAFYRQSGQKMVGLRCRENGPTPISLIADASIIYRLEIHSIGEDAITGSYEVRIKEIRPTTAQDKSRIAGEAAFAEAEELKAESRIESNRKSLLKYQEALSAWQAVGEEQEEANTLKALGEVYHQLGEPQKASNCYSRALQLSQGLKDFRLESEILNDLSYVYVHLGKNQAALEHCSKALTLSRSGGYRREEARSLNNIGEVYYAFGQRDAAIDYYQKALSSWLDLGDRREQAQTLLYLGCVYSDLSEIRKAFDYYDRSFNLWRAVGDQHGQALAMISIAHLHSKLGEKQEALDLYERAMPILQVAGDRVWQGSILLGKAYVYESLGERERALDYYNEALQIFREIHSPANEASTLAVIGGIYFSIGDSQKALANFNQTLTVSRALGDKKQESLAIKRIGSVYSARENHKAALWYYNKALLLYQASNYQRGEADTLNDIGNLYIRSGNKIRALRCFDRALSLNRAASDRFGESQTLYNIARAERDRGHLAAACNQLEVAINIIESLRASVGIQALRTSYFASIQQYFELYIDLLMRRHEQRPLGNFVALGFEQSERARARSLLERLTEARADFLRWGDPALIKRLQELQQQINAKAERKMQLLNIKATEDELLTATKEIASLVIEREQVEAQIRVKRPHDPAITQPQPSGFKEIQQLLDDDTLLLEYALGSERSYLWAVTRTGLKSYELPARAEIEKVARPVYDLLSTSQLLLGRSEAQREADYWRQASVLSRMLLEPVAGQLGNKRLLVVADGVLQYIPFGALPIPESGRTGDKGARRQGDKANPQSVPLIVEHEVVNLPSASTLAVLRREMAGRRPAPKAVAVLANPVFEADDMRVLEANRKPKGALANQVASNNSLPLLRSRNLVRDGAGLTRLPGTENEAKAIEDVTTAAERLIVKGFDANRARATGSELSQYRIIHFATHAVLDRDNPELSAIVLSLVDRQGRPQDGLLHLHDIYNLNLPAELVVLSACNTGLGKEIKGEGLIGLTRGFMYAGAARVMASLWKVEDEATAKLMKHFYRHMLKDGLPPAAALRRAQVALWQDAQWGAPSYWAAFVLQGEWR